MNKPDYSGLYLQKLSKISMHEFWYDYVKPKYGEKIKLCYMGTDSFIVEMLKLYLILQIMIDHCLKEKMKR